MLKPGKIPPRILAHGVCGIAFLLFSINSAAQDEYFVDFSGSLSFESRQFSQSGAYPGQSRQASGFVFEPQLYIEDESGWSFNLSAFHRHDNSDPKREHTDIREAFFLIFGETQQNAWELRLGVDHVFWGVAESVNMVDIINQSDVIEDPLGKENMGQLMAHLTLSGDWGVADLFYLPNHRKRIFPGHRGRLRSALVVDNKLTTYESKSGRQHDDYAARFTTSIGAADVGISVFDGTSRDPSLILHQEKIDSIPVLRPHYERIRQYGLDAALPAGDFLFKLEAIERENSSNSAQEKQDYSAWVVGGEYSLYSVLDSVADVTFFGEWVYDDRKQKATGTFQDELFLSTSISFNDVSGTQLSFAVFEDLDYDSSTYAVELKRRFNDQWSWKFEANSVKRSDQKDRNQYPIRRDSFADFSVIYNF